MMPQLLFIGLSAYAVGVMAAKHGKSYPLNFGATIFSQAIVQGLLYWGGFYDCFFQG